jgi:histidyl-tRNA synthetase
MDRPSLPKGTRDFGPAVMAKRQFIFHSIRTVFEQYGYLPLETPAMENLSTLTGKYGEEGDQLLFKVLNSGDFLKDADPGLLAGRDSRRLAPVIADKGLKYDLTVPFARYVVMNPFQTLPNPTGVASGPTSKRTLPRVLSVRRRCRGHRLIGV